MTRELLVREFPAEFQVGDGRTVDVRIVPYNKPAEVSDGGPVYREEWVEGAFDDQLVAGHRLKVLLNFEHLAGIGNVVGRGVALQSEPDGLHGSFRMSTGEAGDKALELVNDGILDGVSLEAFAKKSVKTAEGVVQRVKAHLHNVALCRNPAFQDAVVLAVRTQPNIPQELLTIDLDAETVARCRRLGIRLPQRYTAHPDTPDTPTQMGTSENGTRQPSTSTNSEGTWHQHSQSSGLPA